MRVIRYPDGTIRSIYDRIFTDKFYIHEDVIYQYGAEKSIADKLQTEESKALELVNDYPVKAWYASFEAYCEDHRGYIQDSEGLWGYTYNPNAKWDWWQIGGRFSRNWRIASSPMIAAVVNLTALPKVISMWMLHARRISAGTS